MAGAIGRTLGFALLYLVAGYAGRLTVMDDTSLSLVWPAAGVAALWFTWQRRFTWQQRAADVLALTAVTVAVNMSTGASAVLTGAFVVANLVQAGIFARLWGSRDLTGLRDLSRLLTAAAVSTVCGAAIGPTTVWLESGHYSWASTAVWLSRNTVSILVIAAVGLRLRGWLQRPSASARLPTRLSARHEDMAVFGLSAGAYVVAFGDNHGLPLAFPLLALTVWAGLRLSTTTVLVHTLLSGTTVVSFTLHGDGPFALIESHPARALLAQLFVGVLAVVALALALGRDERVALVARLRAAEADAAAQASLLGTIIDSMSEGVGVIEDDGRFLLRNPAVNDLLGEQASTGRMVDSGHYGFFRPDGTALADADMPHRRAAADGVPITLDVVVRNPGAPQGRTLSVRATPMVDGSRRTVVVVHDVTAARRHRDELTSFAGVVAHDLLNPLTTVEGWSEALDETLAAAPPSDAVEDAVANVVRIRRAAARMRTLINSLLEYAIARDAALHITDVALRDVVADVATSRIDLAGSTGTPVPRVHVGELHDVQADPVLLRQLLENLVANAVTYTAAGVAPEITITSHRTDDGRVSVEVTDNGIGVPAGQRDAIFDNFHRAHQAYPGNGLGLAVCRRIVERHGGTITADDNPAGGGSRFTFDLMSAYPRTPAAAADAGAGVSASA